MDHETYDTLPYGLRYGPLQKRSNDQIRVEKRYCFLCNLVIDIEFDRDIVIPILQLHVQPLGQAVESMTEEKDTHACQQILGS